MTALFVIFGILALALDAFAGYNKISGQQQMRDAAVHFNMSWDRYRMIGVLEALAALGILIGFFANWLGILAGLGMVVLLVGALVFHSRAGDKLAMMAPAIVVGVVNLLYVIFNAAH